MRGAAVAASMWFVAWVIAIVVALATIGHAAGIPLVDPAGAGHGTAKVVLTRGLISLKITGLAKLPAPVNTGTATFTAYEYKAYLFASADPSIEIFLGDVYPDGRLRAATKAALRGDLSQMGFDKITVTAFSKDGQSGFDVLTAILPQ